jgi:DNA replication and repair protein RecF
VRVQGTERQTAIESEIRLRPGAAKEARLNGKPIASAELLRRRIATLAFTPDRLVIVKGGPAARRAYFDRVLGRLVPAAASAPTDYAAALAQRNAALRRVGLGLSDRSALEPWTERIVATGFALVAARLRALEELSAPFAEQAGALGLDDAWLSYRGEPPTADALDRALARDLERGHTSVGPHRDDVLVSAGDRDLRSFGSQGEQRVAVLALLLAEAGLLAERTGPPLLLLDDVLSELDPDRRRLLAERVSTLGQTVITATSVDALPVDPAQVVDVVPGEARSR